MRPIYFFLLCTTVLFAQTREKCDALVAAGIKAMQEKQYSKSLTLLTEAKTLAQDNRWHKQHFLALNNMGANYYSMLDYGEALRYYLEAYTLALKELDQKKEMTVLNNIAILYLRDKNFDKAEEYLVKAYEIAKKDNNKKRIAIYAVNLGLVSNEKKALNKAQQYLEEALSLAAENPDAVLEAKITLADNHYLRGDFRRARELGLSLLPELEQGNLNEHRLAVLLTLSKVAYREGDAAGSLSYANQALERPVDIESKLLAHQHLADLYAELNQYPKALAAKDSVLSIKDSLHRLRNGSLYETSRVKFEIKNYQAELQRNIESFETERTTYYQIFGGVAVGLLLVGWGSRNRYIRIKQGKIILERNNEIIALALKKEKSDNKLLERQMCEKETLSLLEHERLRNEVELRNRKLSAKALYLSERNELINSIIEDLQASPGLKENKSIESHIIKLKGLLKTDAEWDAFITHFEEVNHGFLTSIRSKHPDLNANDIRYISYIYMNLSHKEIASILHVTPEACRKRKERISKKLGIDDSSQLFNYLATFH